MRLIASLFAIASTVPLLAGCLGCEPHLDVRHCLPEKCAPSPDAIEIAWTPQHTADWPDVARLMQNTEEGSHEHMSWNREREQAFWADFGASGTQREIIATMDGERYRIRVLTCD